ncbi:MAG: hypothetical protein VX940_14415 [Pseudomonadota bacterium]|nr:hypothetical protein [Pseudomonadota bacterium]
MAKDAQTLADALAQRTAAERREAMANAVIENNGSYPILAPMRSLVEIQLYGITATGWGEDQAIANWIKAADPQLAGLEA